MYDDGGCFPACRILHCKTRLFTARKAMFQAVKGGLRATGWFSVLSMQGGFRDGGDVKPPASLPVVRQSF